MKTQILEFQNPVPKSDRTVQPLVVEIINVRKKKINGALTNQKIKNKHCISTNYAIYHKETDTNKILVCSEKKMILVLNLYLPSLLPNLSRLIAVYANQRSNRYHFANSTSLFSKRFFLGKAILSVDNKQHPKTSPQYA